MYQTIELTEGNLEEVAAKVLNILMGKSLRITVRCEHYGTQPIVRTARLRTDLECQNRAPVKRHNEGTQAGLCIRITTTNSTDHYYQCEKVTITNNKVTFEGELSGKPKTVEFEVI